ncbi:MAG: depolymerase family esterase [Herminiimonas sp.]|nr:depolymerase family esterase [Herminiimonas sp.]
MNLKNRLCTVRSDVRFVSPARLSGRSLYGNIARAILGAVLLILSMAAVAMGSRPDTNLIEVNDFGSNPGDLKMFVYVPPKFDPARPLVVALHGCGQQAKAYDEEPGWKKFADQYQFALLLPQEQTHLVRCFRWFEPDQNQRGKGEALSISQMVEKMKKDYKIDPKRIYVTGLSAGGAMTAVMLATYPEVFAGGAIMAGLPYKCASSEAEATAKCGLLGHKLAPEKDLSPAQWGDLVRGAAERNGARPLVSIWHGSNDGTVDPRNQQELMEQWTNVVGIDQKPDADETVNGHLRRVYKDDDGRTLVETYLIKNMGHATPIDPGNAENECGTPAPFIFVADICSTYYVVKFWRLDRQ